MKCLAVKFAACAAALAMSGVAAAQNARTGTMSSSLAASGYVGGSIGRSDYDVSCIGPGACDTKATGGKIFAGTRLNETFGAEVGYVHMGDAALGGGGDSRAHGVNATLMAGVPLGAAFRVDGKLGTTYGWTRVGGPGALGGGKSDGFGVSYGAAASYTISRNVDVRLDWDRHRFDFTRGDENVDLISVGLQYRFQ